MMRLYTYNLRGGVLMALALGKGRRTHFLYWDTLSWGWRSSKGTG